MKPRYFWLCEDFLKEADEKGLIRKTPPIDGRGYICVQRAIVIDWEKLWKDFRIASGNVEKIIKELVEKQLAGE